MGLAAAALLAGVVGLPMVFAAHESNPPPLLLQVFFGFFVGSFLALLVLGIGYVNRDARERGMKAGLWTAIVIFVPNALGFILYFLLRSPRLLRCPGCQEPAAVGSRYCGRCARPLARFCPACREVVRADDVYCTHCGGALVA